MGILRFILAMSVVLGHGAGYAFLIPFNGNAAVYCFFMISGFYMALILNEKYTFTNGPLSFYASRFIRIFPLYWVIIAVVLLYQIVFHSGRISYILDSSLDNTSRTLAALANGCIIGIDHMRGPLAQSMGLPKDWRLIPQSWSLEPEILFYIASPLLLKRITFHRIAAILIVSSAMFIFRVRMLEVGLWLLIPSSLVFFAVGAGCYLVYKQLPALLIKHSAIVCIGISGLFLTWAYIYRLDQVSKAISSEYATLYVATAMLIPHAFYATKKSRIDAYIGELSYPIYLVHLFVIQVSGDLGLSGYGWLSTIGIVVVVVLLSIGILRLLIRPLDHIRIRLASPSLAPTTEFLPKGS